MTSYKVLLAGDGGVGKTTFVRRCKDPHNRERRYISTIGVEVHPIDMTFPDGNEFTCKLWDLAGQEKFGGLRDGYFVNADAAIIMVDLSASLRMLMFGLKQWYCDIRRACPDIPILIVANKMQLSRHNLDEFIPALEQASNCPVLAANILYENKDSKRLIWALMKNHKQIQHQLQFRHALKELAQGSSLVKHGGALEYYLTHIHWQLHHCEVEDIYEQVCENTPELVHFFAWHNAQEMVQTVEYWYAH